MGTISSVCVNSVTLFVLEDVHFLWRVDKCTCLWRIQISRQDDWCDWIQDDHVMSLCEDTARRCCRGVNRKWKTRAGGVGVAKLFIFKGRTIVICYPQQQPCIIVTQSTELVIGWITLASPKTTSANSWSRGHFWPTVPPPSGLWLMSIILNFIFQLLKILIYLKKYICTCCGHSYIIVFLSNNLF